MMKTALVPPALGHRYFVDSPIADSEVTLTAHEAADDPVSFNIGAESSPGFVAADLGGTLAEFLGSPGKHTHFQGLVAPIEIDSEGSGVLVNEESMEFHRPYPYQIGGIWFVAVRHDDDRRVAFYQLT